MDRLGVAHPPEVWLMPVPIPPMLWAVLRTPRLLLPVELWERLSEEQRDTLLAHELVHLRGRDHWVRRLEEHALLAEDLGAEVIRTSSSDIAMKMVEVARERQITQIVLGQPARSRWEEFIRGSIINRLLRLSTDIDIHLVPRSDDE